MQNESTYETNILPDCLYFAWLSDYPALPLLGAGLGQNKVLPVGHDVVDGQSVEGFDSSPDKTVFCSVVPELAAYFQSTDTDDPQDGSEYELPADMVPCCDAWGNPLSPDPPLFGEMQEFVEMHVVNWEATMAGIPDGEGPTPDDYFLTSRVLRVGATGELLTDYCPLPAVSFLGAVAVSIPVRSDSMTPLCAPEVIAQHLQALAAYILDGGLLPGVLAPVATEGGTDA